MPSEFAVCQICGGPTLDFQPVCDRCRRRLLNVVHDLDPHQHVDVINEGPYATPTRFIVDALPLLEISEDLVVVIARQQETIKSLNALLDEREDVIHQQQAQIDERSQLIAELEREITGLFDSLAYALAAETGARLQLEGLREQIETLLATRPMLPPDYEWETTGILPRAERNVRFDAGWDIAWVYVGENEQDGTMRWYRPGANGHTK